MIARLIGTGAIVLVTTALATTSLAAAEDFYKDKTITIIVSTGAGGSYYNIAQAFSRHMPQYIPGRPNIIVKAMPGAGNVRATNFLYNQAPKDGTTIGTINNSIPLHQALGGKGVRYDATKFHWFGSTGTYNSVAYVWHDKGIKSFEDLKKKETVLGGTGAGSSIVIYPRVMNTFLGTKFRIVLGYKSTGQIDIAMQAGELAARTGSYTGLVSDHPDWLAEKKVVIVAQIGSKRDPRLKDIPLITELTANPEHRKILELISSPIAVGRPYIAPPGVPKDRIAILQKAYDATLRDKAFLAEMKKLRTEIDPVPGDEVAKVVNETMAAPKDIVEKAKAAMEGR
ncbi:MAG: Bug family tripartite tricarboxylate transporter substrate binding protein [Beijerinckiaceae bacterium]